MLLFPSMYKFYQNRSLQNLRKLLNSFYEKEFKHLNKIVGPKMHLNEVLDIGSNSGQSSQALNHIFNIGKLHMFEPSPPMASLCRKLKLPNCKNFEVHEFGLSNHKTKTSLNVPIYNGVTFWGLASLDPDFHKGLLNPNNIWNYDPKKIEIRSLAIYLKTLDSLDLKPDFIKIDVEGFELEVIFGGIETIKKIKPMLLIECTRTLESIRGVLIPLGYLNFELFGDRWRVSQGASLNQLFISPS